MWENELGENCDYTEIAVCNGTITHSQFFLFLSFSPRMPEFLVLGHSFHTENLIRLTPRWETLNIRKGNSLGHCQRGVAGSQAVCWGINVDIILSSGNCISLKVSVKTSRIKFFQSWSGFIDLFSFRNSERFVMSFTHFLNGRDNSIRLFNWYRQSILNSPIARLSTNPVFWGFWLEVEPCF